MTVAGIGGVANGFLQGTCLLPASAGIGVAAFHPDTSRRPIDAKQDARHSNLVPRLALLCWAALLVCPNSPEGLPNPAGEAAHSPKKEPRGPVRCRGNGCCFADQDRDDPDPLEPYRVMGPPVGSLGRDKH